MRVLSIAAFAVCLLLPFAAVSAEFKDLFDEDRGHEDPEVNFYLHSFNYRQGEVKLPGGQAVLTVPEGYYYLDPRDAAIVLTLFWDNPHGESLGMIFPAAYTPIEDEAWGALLWWDPMGYVSDEDAETLDYDALLVDMKEETRWESQERVDAGYDAMELIGWAAPPSYDRRERKLHWALELAFAASETNTLNYELRALGREGVLSAIFIGSIGQLEQITSALPDVAKMIAFVEGKRYANFDPSVDKIAVMGIGGLIAGNALAKGGLIALALVLVKKFWFILLLPFLGLRKLLSKRNS